MSYRTLLFNGPIIDKRTDRLEMDKHFLRIGIASIYSFLKEKGVIVKIVDPSNEIKEIYSLLEKFRPQIVGIPAFTNEINSTAKTARWIKSLFPEIRFIIGGPHATAVPEKTLQEFPIFNIAVIGEAEKTMLEICQGKDKHQIKGICFYNKSGQIITNPKNDNLVDINTLPFPDWNGFDLDKYKGSNLLNGFSKRKKGLELPIEGARGCPYNCIFCFRTLGQNMRFKKPQRIVEEIERNVIEFGANRIHFVEGSFGVREDFAKELCQEIILRKLNRKIRWSAGGRVNLLQDKHLLEIMKESGCDYLGIGVESGNQEQLKRISKNISLSQIQKAFENCHTVGITTEAEFIIGHPFDTRETILQSIKLACHLPTQYATFAILVPFPGTEVCRMAERNIGGLKITSHEWDKYGKQIGESLELEQLPHHELVKLQALAYQKFYLRPSHLPYLIKRLNKERLIYGLKNIIKI